MFMKRRNLLISEVQILGTLKILNDLGITQSVITDFNLGNCRWAKAPDCWFISFRCRDKKWYNILKKLKEEGIMLLPETTGY